MGADGSFTDGLIGEKLFHEAGDSEFVEGASAAERAVSCATLDDSEAAVCRFRKQAVQHISVNSGWLVAINDNDLNNSFFEGSIGLAVPLGSFDNVLGITPYFRADWMDAGAALDISSELYDTGVKFFWQKPLNDRWSVMTLVSPSVRGDFTTSDGTVRVFGMGLLVWQKVPDRLSLSFGAVYLDRPDIPLLPAVGLTWTPDVRRRLDLRFPESRMSWRLEKDGARSETWSYVAAGFGGNTWAVTRQTGAQDQLSLRFLKLAVGVERILDGGAGWFVECGLALDRTLEYEVTETEIGLSDAFLVQAGWSW